MNKKIYTSLTFLCLFLNAIEGQNLIRGPYLQAVSQDKITVRWRTDIPTASKVWYGESSTNLTEVVENNSIVTEHELSITDLAPNTTYFYAIGYADSQIAGATTDHYFKTSPLPLVGESINIWALGDAGRKNTAQRSVRDAFYSYNNGEPVDLLLTMGDNAYSDGTDEEFQDAWFENMYEDRLINIPMFQTYGNHDGESADGEDGTGVYFDIFTHPTDGSCGGVPSGNESYYSFNYADVHFVSLNTWDVDRSPNSAMAQWLEADLAANNQTWTIVNFHHPVYDGRYNIDSDSKSLNIEMRESFVPIFDQYGVDLVLMGHSHTYQRSYLIDGHYDVSSTFDPVTMGINMGDGQIDGDGAYQKVNGKGVVYVISGTAGTVNSVDNLYHPVMYHSSLTLGSFILDISHDQLDAKFLTADGIIDDYFTITKDIAPVQLVQITNPLQGFSTPQNAIITTEIAENIGAVSAVEFFINGSTIGIDNTFPFTMDWTIPANGPYDIELLATTNFGAYTDSVHIVVGDQIYPEDSDGDGTLDADDLCAGSLEPGTICNDNNTATYDDVITASCNCVGTPYDCPILLMDIGMACDDNNPATYDDIVNGNCTCSGIPFDCAVYLADIGTPCNDNDPDTYGETLNANCDCVGLPLTNVVTSNIKLLEGSDDAEEAANGSVNLSSSDLEMVEESSEQTIGLRYALANVAEGAYIVEAYLQFAVDEIDSAPTTLTIRGDMSNNSPTFSNTNGNISSRPRTTNVVVWDVGSWLTVGAMGDAQRSVDLSTIIQEMVDQQDYSSSSPITFIIEGSGKRVAFSKDKYLSDGPELVLTYGFLCPDMDNDGICDQDDLCPDNPGSVGEPCNDNNPNTTNDVYNSNCECIGDEFDCLILNANIGSPCNDNNAATYNDLVDSNCNCSGTAYDCPIFLADVGTTCDDDNPATYNDLLDVNCNCTGTPYDCENFLADIGTSCDDFNNNTTNDQITSDCQCVGTAVAATITVSTKVSASSDDAEQRANGSITLSSTDLEMVEEKSTQQVGIRFVNSAIPTNANIVSAYIQFTTDEAVNQDQTNLQIFGEANANPSTFVKSTANISNRPRTAASVNWQPMEWNTVGEDGMNQRTADLSVIIQELINLPNYVENNALVFLIEGNGKRVAESFDGSTQNAATLVVTYSTGMLTYDCPQLELNIGESCDDNNSLTANDVVSANCVCAGEVIGTTFDCPSLELNFGASCDDNDPTTINDVIQNDCSCSGIIPMGFACSRISATNDDAEEKPNGSVNLTSSDLELVESSSTQTIGLRFLNLEIPAEALISTADIQFTVDEAKNTSPCELLIYGELHNNPGPFTSNSGNISGRIKTNTYLSWMPEEWPTVNESGTSQQTVDIAPILQEIIGQTGYNSNSSIVIIIEGVGTRTAESYDGDENKAAELCVEYDMTNINSAQQNERIEEEESIASEFPSVSSLHVFPNPARDYLTLRFDAHKVDKEATVQIWSANGRLVHNEKRQILKGQEEIKLEGLTLANGTYTIQLHRAPFMKAAKFVVLK